METNTELLNRIEAHIKGRLAVAESRAASSELYDGKKIAYNSILGFVKGLRAETIPEDVQEAANQYIGYPHEVDEGVSTSLRRKAFADGMLAERERLMKEAPVADVIEMSGSIGPFTDYPFMLSLGFRKIPNIEYHGGKVRVIIEEINQTTLK